MRAWLPSIAVLILLVAPGAGLLSLVRMPVQRAFIGLQHPQFQMDPEEGALLFQAMQIGRGESIYRPLVDEPYVVGTYPPVYLWICSWFADPELPSFAAGRVVSLVALGGILVCIVVIVSWRARNPLLGLLAASMFMVTYPVFRWTAYYRVDMLAIFLSLAGLTATVLWPRRRSAMMASIALFALALFTKQTEVAAPAAVCFAAILRDRKEGLKYLAFLAAAVLVPFAILSAITGGQFAVHTIYYNMNEFVWGDVKSWARHAWLFYRWLIVAAAVSAGSAGWLCWRGRRSDAVLDVDPLSLFLVFSIFNFLAVGKSGSAENYLLTPLAAMAMASCDVAGRLARVWTLRRLVVSVLLAGLFLLHGLRIHALAPIMLNPAQNPGPSDFAAASRIAQIVRQSETSWSELAVFNLLAGRSPHYQPFIMNELVRQNKLDGMGWIDKLRDGKIKTLVTNTNANSNDYTNVYSPEMRATIQSLFREKERITSGRYWTYYVYEYIGAAHASPVKPE